ncbi:MAG: DUF4388 domain-containing protein [Myxococcales bacterium]|jgi:hypothetical protein|nr:DUF4388 domain-containing protein [Myxococcales bacterium]
MDSLAGELTTMEIGEVLSLLGKKRLTGQLLIEAGPRRKSFFIQDGQLIQSASNLEEESFGNFLRQIDRISEAQLQMAIEANLTERTLLGVQLIRLGFMTEADVCEALVLRIRESLLGVVQWTDATFRFLRGVMPSDRPALEVALDIAALLPEVAFREMAWASMRSVFVSDQITFRVRDDRLATALLPDAVDDKLLALMRQGHTFAEIEAALYRSRFFLQQKIFALIGEGIVEPAPDRSSESPLFIGESMDDPTQLIALAHTLVTSGRFEQAALVAAQAIELSPTPEAQKLLAHTEAAHLAALQRSLVEPNPALRMTCDASKLDRLALTPQERYLLSRIDGTRTVRSLLRVTPMRALDTLKCIEHFTLVGYIGPSTGTPVEPGTASRDLDDPPEKGAPANAAERSIHE